MAGRRPRESSPQKTDDRRAGNGRDHAEQGAEDGFHGSPETEPAVQYQPVAQAFEFVDQLGCQHIAGRAAIFPPALASVPSDRTNVA